MPPDNDAFMRYLKNNAPKRVPAPAPVRPTATTTGNPPDHDPTGRDDSTNWVPAPPPAPGNDGGAGGGTTEMAIDWRSWLEDWGFPPEVITNLDQMARRYTPAQADMFARDAILYLRGTDWHKQTFVGFADAYKSGLIQDERQYRMYVQSANDYYQRYHNRQISTDELLNAFRSGYNVERIGLELDAGAFVNANRDELQYLSGNFGDGAFSASDLQSIGRQKVGVTNALGQELLTKVGKAQERLRRIFEGTLSQGEMAAPRGRTSGAGSTLSDIGR